MTSYQKSQVTQALRLLETLPDDFKPVELVGVPAIMAQIGIRVSASRDETIAALKNFLGDVAPKPEVARIETGEVDISIPAVPPSVDADDNAIQPIVLDGEPRLFREDESITLPLDIACVRTYSANVSASTTQEVQVDMAELAEDIAAYRSHMGEWPRNLRALVRLSRFRRNHLDFSEILASVEFPEVDGEINDDSDSVDECELDENEDFVFRDGDGELIEPEGSSDDAAGVFFRQALALAQRAAGE